MPDDIRNLTESQRDALAKSALKAADRSRQRAKEYRDRKRAKGMTQISIWVPADQAKSLKKMFEKHVLKMMAGKDQAGSSSSTST